MAYFQKNIKNFWAMEISKNAPVINNIACNANWIEGFLIFQFVDFSHFLQDSSYRECGLVAYLRVFV